MRKELPISFYRRAAYNSLKKSLQIITVLSIKTDHALGRFLELQPRLIFLEFERRIRYNDWRREENAFTFLMIQTLNIQDSVRRRVSFQVRKNPCQS